MRASIEYMNARRASKPASGGTNYATETAAETARRLVDERALDREADASVIAMAHIGAFSLWAETTRQVLCERLGIPQTETFDEIPF
jgi:hypothetical protein